MSGGIVALAAISLVAFTALGLVQRWSLRLSLTYALTMTVFLSIVSILANVAIEAV